MNERRRRALVTAIVVSGVFLASLDLFIVNIAFPDIARDFEDSSLSEMSWILNAYAIVFAALLVPAGRWADRAGRKRGFLYGLALFTLASAVSAAAPSLEVLVGARVLQAGGAALMVPTSLGLLIPEFPAERRAAVVALWAAVGGVAAAAGPPIGGVLVEASWRWVFLVNIPIGLVALVAGARTLREIRDPSGERPDVLGAAMLAGGIGALTGAIVKGPDWGWGDTPTVALFATAAALVALVVARSRTHPAPVVEPELVRIRSTAFANLAAMLFFAGFGALLLGSVLFLTSVWGESTLSAGLMVAPGPAMAAVFSVPSGLLGERYGARLVGAAGAVVIALSAIWWVSTMGSEPDYAGTFLAPFMLGGVGVGLAIPSITGVATAALPPTRFATGTALVGMSRQIGAALGVAVLVAIVGTPAPGDAVATFGHGWLFVAGAMGATGIAMLLTGPAVVRASAVPTAAGQPA
ncbi:MAG TPA: MFS transporter [Thermoleophilaceae bacterium]|jgi:EmrB/QacA subfamily drug resistance transporter